MEEQPMNIQKKIKEVKEMRDILRKKLQKEPDKLSLKIEIESLEDHLYELNEELKKEK